MLCTVILRFNMIYISPAYMVLILFVQVLKKSVFIMLFLFDSPKKVMFWYTYMAWISPSDQTYDLFSACFLVLMLHYFYHSCLWDKYTGRDTYLCLLHSLNPVTMFRHVSQLSCVRVKLQSIK